MKITFSTPHSAFYVKAPKDTMVCLFEEPTTVKDGVYVIGDEGAVSIDEGWQADAIYLSTTGTDYTVADGQKVAHPAEGVEIRASFSAVPFKVSGKGGGGSSGGCNYKGTTTTAISNGSTTNPITIDGESYTAVFGDIVVYGYTEFVFDGTTWSEFGRPFDTTPTSGSANAVTSDGIYWNTAGKKSDNGKGEIFNTYTGFIKNIASGNKSHAEGNGTIASGNYSHAEGLNTTASGVHSHAEGRETNARGVSSHAEGFSNTASGDYSHAGGLDTIATAESSTVIGRCNVADGTGAGDPKHLFIVGNGPDAAHRSNILEVDTTSLNVNGDIQQNGVPLRATTMPTITSSMLGKVVQYVGASDSNYKQGWNYVAVSDGAAEPTYSWQALMDSVPTSGSANAVTSDGIYQSINDLSMSVTKRIAGGANNTAVKLGNQGYSGASYTLTFGYASNAAGLGGIALGEGTYAQTFTLACGRYNASYSDSRFVVGNGTSASNRSNIVEVNATSMNVNGDIQKNGVSLPTPYTTMPTITEAMLGQIAMYVGTTDANYTQGYFYIASSDGAAEPTYSWVNLSVSPRTYSETVLWANPNPTVSNPSTITLSSAYTNFDEIVIVEKHIATNNTYTSTAKYLVSAMTLNDMLGVALGDAGGLFTWYKLTAADELTEQISGLILHSIIGIKY